jgi:xanthine/uracil permease
MLKLFAQHQVIVLAALGSLACGMAALVYEGGYRRGPVGLAVACIFVSTLLPLLPYWGSADSAVILLISLISGCMALATVFLVPLLTIAGLSDRSCPLKTRLRQAVFVISAWILGCGWIFSGLLGFH